MEIPHRIMKSDFLTVTIAKIIDQSGNFGV